MVEKFNLTDKELASFANQLLHPSFEAIEKRENTISEFGKDAKIVSKTSDKIVLDISSLDIDM